MWVPVGAFLGSVCGCRGGVVSARLESLRKDRRASGHGSMVPSGSCVCPFLRAVVCCDRGRAGSPARRRALLLRPRVRVRERTAVQRTWKGWILAGSPRANSQDLAKLALEIFRVCIPAAAHDIQISTNLHRSAGAAQRPLLGPALRSFALMITMTFAFLKSACWNCLHTRFQFVRY